MITHTHTYLQKISISFLFKKLSQLAQLIPFEVRDILGWKSINVGKKIF